MVSRPKRTCLRMARSAVSGLLGVQRSDQVTVKTRRQGRAAGGNIEQPVENQHVVLLDHGVQHGIAGVFGDLEMKSEMVTVDGVEELAIIIGGGGRG